MLPIKVADGKYAPKGTGLLRFQVFLAESCQQVSEIENIPFERVHWAGYLKSARRIIIVTCEPLDGKTPLDKDWIG